jgi:prepilin-type N-terminal cleavage/methylation domain-containing protein
MNDRCHKPANGFTLIEVMVSLAVFTFAILVIMASLGTSGSYAANDARRSAAVEILHTCFRDIDLAKSPGTETSPTLGIEPIPWEGKPAKVRLWFDIDGRKVGSEKDAFFKCDLTPRRDPAARLGHLHGRIAWPAKRQKGASDGDVELFTTLLLP